VLNGASTNGKHPSIGTIARVAPFLSAIDRRELGVVDAEAPAALARLRWSDGALIGRLSFIDRKSEANATFSVHGAVAANNGRFVRFAPATARAFAHRFLEAGFVPRGSDAFALHDVERAATFVREVVGDWDDVDIILDDSLSAVASGESAMNVSISARPTDVDGERDWFELNVDVFVGDGSALTPKELAALLQSSGRYAEVRGKLFDVEALRMRRTLLSELNDRRRTGMAALVALHDEIHEAFGDVALPEEVEILRARLRNFSGIEEIEPPASLAKTLRGYQRRGLDFLQYLASFRFGGILADEMGLGKTLEMITYLLHRKEMEGAAPCLVIAPTSVTHTWENEIARFAPTLSTLRWQSGADRAQRYAELENYDVIITSYALARDRKSTRLNSSHWITSRMPSSA
jgi:hypothetical protein